MRLLNAETLEFAQFFEPNVPEYVILSHRWEKDEVTFQEVRDRQNELKAGWDKVKHFCALVAEKHFQVEENPVQWAWIDTCCIDKTSSAELTEAVNSMFRWYQGAVCCYAYLCDVNPYSFTEEQLKNSLQQSEWFTGGWTPQKLLAPKDFNSFASNWKTLLGNRSDLSSTIAGTTGIDSRLLSLRSGKKLHEFSIAKRMCWASRRRFKRQEDTASCLIGLFNVQMPLLYGKGAERAFLRLQLQILEMFNDESLFAWTLPGNMLSWGHSSEYGLMASSLEWFGICSDVEVWPYDRERPPSSMTNKGLHFEPLAATIPRRSANTIKQFLVRPSDFSLSHEKDLLLVPLNCRRYKPFPQYPQQIWLVLHKNNGISALDDVYIRLAAEIAFETLQGDSVVNLHLILKHSVNQRRAIYVPQHNYQYFSRRFKGPSGSMGSRSK